MPLNFIPTRLTIKVKLEDHIGELEVEAVVAEQTGLAYITYSSEAGKPHMKLSHLVTGTSLGDNWGTSSEQEAKAWITLLHEVIDWTEAKPSIRQGKLAAVLNLAVIGAVHQVESEDAQ
jgi:hypothetical protein